MTCNSALRADAFDATLWSKVHAMGNIMFDTIRDVADALERNEPIDKNVANQVKTITTCGFCSEQMNVYKSHNQIYVRFGSCGHLFHADPHDVRLKRSCYNRYIDSKKQGDNVVCLHCRRKTVNPPEKRRRIEEEDIEPAVAAVEAMPEQSTSDLSDIEEEETGELPR